MPDLHVLPTPEETAQAAAAFVATLADRRIETEGRFTVALSGGSTPRRLYQILAAPPYAERIAWDRWQVFWGDERCVPPDHQDSNFRMAKEALLDHVSVPPNHIYRIRGEANPQDAAQEYQQRLLEVFKTSRPVFDMILLGIGDDGHTASLFPGTRALEEKRQFVSANWVPHLQAYRITFTLPLINAAIAVAFLVTDKAKADVLRRVVHPPPGVPVPPAALVRPVSGSVHWFLTRAVASRLTEVSV